MRICVLANTFPNKSQTFVAQQVAGLIRGGAELDIYAKNCEMSDEELKETFPELVALGVRNATRYYAPHTDAGFAEALAYISTVSAYCLRHPLRTPRILDFLRYTRDFAALKILSVADEIGRGGFSAFLCQFGPLGNMGLLLNMLNGTNVKVATMFRGSDLTSYERRHPAVYCQLFRIGDLFLPVSSYFKELLLEKGVDPNKVEVHHSGIDCEKFAFLEKLSVVKTTVHPFTFISVGRFTEKKGFPYILEAAAVLRGKGYNFRLRIIGDGPLKSFLEDFIVKNSMTTYTELLPWIPHDKIVAVYRTADAFISHNIVPESGDMEGIPNVLKEAMATGLPVVATRHAGISDLVEDGVGGFLVQERDVDTMVEKMAQLIGGHDVTAMRRAARQQVETRFDGTRLSERLIELLLPSLQHRTSATGE